MTVSENDNLAIIRITAMIVTSMIKQGNVTIDNLPRLIASTHSSLEALSSQSGLAPNIPAVAISNSICEDYIICLEDGVKVKMLKRHLRVYYNMSPDEYRKKWGLPRNYPMTSPAYSKKRSNIAVDLRFGYGSVGKRIAKTGS